MTQSNGPGNTPEGNESMGGRGSAQDESLDLRGRELDAKLASHRKTKLAEVDKSRGTTGYGQAFKLSGEFIAGIVVGAGLGWFIDHLAGTAPWGLIVFLLLGFCAGILNVLRSAGVVAEAGIRAPGSSDETGRKNE